LACPDGKALASGTYLPGPTLAGVDVSFFNVCPLLNPNVYFSDILYTGFSGGLY